MSREIPLTKAFWTYRAMPDPWSNHHLGVVDGDTVDLLVDQGFRDYSRIRVRLDGIDTAELYGTADGSPEHELAEDQAAHVAAWLADAAAAATGPWPLVVQTYRDATGKYGRLLAAVVRRSDDSNLTTSLVDEWPTAADD